MKRTVIQMNEHSKMFDKIKQWYTDGMWSKKKVHNAVTNPKSHPYITPEEYEEITGEPYEE